YGVGRRGGENGSDDRARQPGDDNRFHTRSFEGVHCTSNVRRRCYTAAVMTKLVMLVAAAATLAAAETSRQAPERGQERWGQRLPKTAIAALEVAAADKATAAEAYEALGRIYIFKGWQQEAVFPGWHDEPSYRPKAIAALKASLKADPNRASARDALRTAEEFESADSVPPSKEKTASA